MALIGAPDSLIDLSKLIAKPEIVVARVKACGFSNVTVGPDRVLQDDVIEVSGVATASEQQMRCVAEASISSIYYVQFPEPLNQRYQHTYWRLAEEQDRRDARAWFEARRLLTKVPEYEAGKTDDLRFARKLEALCGPKASGSFVREHGHVTLKMGTFDHPAIDEATFTCLTRASAASGFPMGLVGNEYYQTK
jgi:hypothetical protein